MAGRDGHGTGAGGPAGGEEALDRIATIPNALSAVRILLIPVFVFLLLHPGTGFAGLLLLGFTVATDWVDGYLARRTGQVSNLGKLLDPIADRLALVAALAALVARGVFPLWAALLVIVRDGVVLLGGAAVLARTGLRIDVRWIGKLATFGLMWAIPGIAWGGFGFPFAAAFRTTGWILFAAGIVAYYAALCVYALDVRRALRDRAPGRA